MSISDVQGRCLTMWAQAEGFSQQQMPGDALARARCVQRELEAISTEGDPQRGREVERLRKKAAAEVARYEAQRGAWAAEIVARRERLEAREAAERLKPIP